MTQDVKQTIEAIVLHLETLLLIILFQTTKQQLQIEAISLHYLLCCEINEERFETSKVMLFDSNLNLSILEETEISQVRKNDLLIMEMELKHILLLMENNTLSEKILMEILHLYLSEKILLEKYVTSKIVIEML
jgi:hypothetical protein